MLYYLGVVFGVGACLRTYIASLGFVANGSGSPSSEVGNSNLSYPSSSLFVRGESRNVLSADATESVRSLSPKSVRKNPRMTVDTKRGCKSTHSVKAIFSMFSHVT